MNVAIIGCGLIGRKRALALDKSDTLVACCDTNPMIADQFAKDFNCKQYLNPEQLIQEINCQVIIISVINKFAHDICIFALNKGVHVLVEKPLGLNEIEALSMFKLAKIKNLILKTGFNHRFHPSILKAKNLIEDGLIGNLLIIRSNYGHGSRIGMETEWRSSKLLCGGGELLDQGVHIIDLARWFAGEIKTVYGKIKTKFWDIEVEDNAFVILESENGIDIQFHVSWTNWKNVFIFEIFGSKGYIKINGLGGNYGTETLEIGIRNNLGGAPDINSYTFNEKDNSWILEWADFKNAIIEEKEPIGSGFDGYKANEIVKYIYESSIASLPINIIKNY